MTKANHAAIWGLFIGDAMAMPVHWYYSPQDIKKDYGSWLTGYEAPKDKHPTSIMNLSNKGGSGRSTGKESKQIIGDVILHDKLKYWTQGKGVHYHASLKAGENTLNPVLGFATLQHLNKVDPDGKMEAAKVRESFLENYVRFMTTPGSHNDSYAESSHRLFFQQWSELENPPTNGEALLKFCEERYKLVNPETEDVQINCIGSFVFAVPWIVHYANSTSDVCAKNTVEALKLTHPAPSLMDPIELYARLLHAVIQGADLKTEVLKTADNPVLGSPNKRKVIEKFSTEASKHEKDSEGRLRVYQEAVSILGMACYIPGSMCSMLFLAHEFAEDIQGGVTTNANCGGENAHRGGALGALLAANMINKGLDLPQELMQGLGGKDNYQTYLQ